MTVPFLNTDALPFCKGCGHSLIAKNTAISSRKSQYQPLDVIMVTDIGCHGIIDKTLNTHTVHGLHGRSAALGAGVSFGMKIPKKNHCLYRRWGCNHWPAAYYGSFAPQREYDGGCT
jgi:pyruvate/2-oxoacid:ferredoxin oxidoreductase beta subunit